MNKKPKLKLIPLEKTAVDLYDLTEYELLMKIYECGGWKWRGGDLPTEYDQLKMPYPSNGKVCIDAGVDGRQDGKYNEGIFGFDNRETYSREHWKIISLQEFLNLQTPKITSGKIKEINKWFTKHKYLF